MEQYYYLDENNQTVGPFSWNEFQKLHLPDDTQVWRKGLGSWVSLSTMPNSTSGKGFFQELNPLKIILLIYAGMGALFMLVLGRFIYAFLLANTYQRIDEFPWYILVFLTILLVLVFIIKRRYVVYVLLVLFPFWIGSLSAGFYYKVLCDASYYEGNYCIIKKFDKGEGVINQWGMECVPCIYDHVSFDGYLRNQHQYCHIFLNHKAGICDMNGNILVPCEWGGVIEQKRGWKVFDSNNLWGMLDDDGTLLIPCKYDRITKCSFNNSLIEVQKGDWFGLLNLDGTCILDCNYLRTKFNDDGLAKLNEGGYVDDKNHIKGGRWGIINKKGRMIVPCIYDDVDRCSNTIDCYLARIIYVYDHSGNILNIY